MKQKDSEIKSIEDDFKNIADNISLVFKIILCRSFSQLILITGDASKTVLDELENLKSDDLCDLDAKQAFFIRATHHGTRFGKYLENYRTEILWISWKDVGYGPIKNEYYTKINAKHILVPQYGIGKMTTGIINLRENKLKYYIKMMCLRKS